MGIHISTYIYITFVRENSYAARANGGHPLCTQSLLFILPKKKKGRTEKEEIKKNPLFDKIIYIYISLSILPREPWENRISPREKKKKKKSGKTSGSLEFSVSNLSLFKYPVRVWICEKWNHLAFDNKPMCPVRKT